eukprot:8014039-Lingulodinium_polyedra.AAC.1
MAGVGMVSMMLLWQSGRESSATASTRAWSKIHDLSRWGTTEGRGGLGPPNDGMAWDGMGWHGMAWDGMG